MIKSAKCERFLYLMNCIKIVSFVMRKNMFKQQKRKSLYYGKSNSDGQKQNNKKSIKDFLRLLIHNIIPRGKMSRREWVGAIGVSIPEKDVPEEAINEASAVYSQVVTPFLKIVNDEPLTMLGTDIGDTVGIRIGNQSSSGTVCADQIIEPKKPLTLPTGEFNLEITKLREKPSGIISEVRAYLGEL